MFVECILSVERSIAHVHVAALLILLPVLLSEVGAGGHLVQLY